MQCTYKTGSPTGLTNIHIAALSRAARGKAAAMFMNFEAIQKFGKDQIEATTAATAELTKGLQTIATEATDYSKKSMASSKEHMEKLMAVKKLDEAMTLQTDFAKSAYEGFVAQLTKMTELYTSVAKEAFKPVEGIIAKAQVAAK